MNTAGNNNKGFYIMKVKFSFDNRKKEDNNKTVQTTREILYSNFEEIANAVKNLDSLGLFIPNRSFNYDIEAYHVSPNFFTQEVEFIQIYGEDADDYIKELKSEYNVELMKDLVDVHRGDKYFDEIYWLKKEYLSSSVDRYFQRFKKAYNKRAFTRRLNKRNYQILNLMKDIYSFYYNEVLTQKEFHIVKAEEKIKNKQFPTLPWTRSKNHKVA